MGLAKDFKNPKVMQAKLQPLLEAITMRIAITKDSIKYESGEWLKIFNKKFGDMPEYRQLKRIIHNDHIETALLQLYDHLGHEMNTSYVTGEILYRTLTDMMYTYTGRDYGDSYHAADRAAKVAASAYLNSKGIPGHRFFDRNSRYDTTGQHRTHNYVIWNIDKTRMVGIDTTSDRYAIEYYNKYKHYAETFGESEELLTPDRLDAIYAKHHLVSPSQVEQYEQLMYHGTDNTIRGNRFNLRWQPLAVSPHLRAKNS